jgi:hypothetical protein
MVPATQLAPHWSINDELKVVRSLGAPAPAFLLEGACRELATNSEENHRYIEASRLRYCAMDARRRQSWRGTWGVSSTFLYWLLSGYGELQGRALGWLGLILFGFALFYWQLDFPQDQGFLEALIYSFGIMTRQRLADQPDPGLVQFLVILEGVLGPLQIALFALALRRKFMK